MKKKYLIIRKKDGSEITPEEDRKIRDIVEFIYLTRQPHQKIELPEGYDKQETLAGEIPELVQTDQILDENIKN